MTIKELMEKRATSWNAAKDFVTNHTNENGLMSDADRETYDKMEKDIMDYTKEIERMRRQEEIDKSLNQAMSTPITEKPMKQAEDEKPVSLRESKEYKNAVISALRSNFKTISNVMQEGVDADGGYLVPDELERKIVKKMEGENILRKLATVIKTSGDHKINIADTTPAANWVDEGGALVFGDATFKQINLDAHKLQVAIKVTEELLYDNAFDLENYISERFGIAIANAEEDAFLNGNGTGRPTGIFDATNGGTIAITLDNTNLKADNIIDLVYKLKRGYRKNAAFLMNDTTIALIRKLKDNNGQFLWQPSLQVGEPDRVFGYPVHTSQFCNSIEAGKPFIAFGDFHYYKIGDRGNRTFQELKELYAGNGMIGFVAKQRVDGKLVLPEAVQIMKVKASTTTTDSGTTGTTTP